MRAEGNARVRWRIIVQIRFVFEHDTPARVARDIIPFAFDEARLSRFYRPRVDEVAAIRRLGPFKYR